MSSSHLDSKITWWRNWVWLPCVWTCMTIRNSCSSNQWWKSYCSPCLYVAGLALGRKVWQATRCADGSSKRAADADDTRRDFHDNLQVQNIGQLYTSRQGTRKHHRHGLTETQNIQGRDGNWKWWSATHDDDVLGWPEPKANGEDGGQLDRCLASVSRWWWRHTQESQLASQSYGGGLQRRVGLDGLGQSFRSGQTTRG
jgi:hypothetical protein